MSQQKIAVVGMSCRFPNAPDVESYWEMLRGKESAVAEIPHSRLPILDHYSAEPARNKSISKWAGLVDHFDLFDAGYFKILPREVELMDPQQRIALELAVECLEDAGYGVTDVRGKSVGVFFGACNFDYKERLEKATKDIQGHMATGTYNTFIPNRISHFLDLKGPSIAIDTACSSSLVALSAAIQSVQSGDCESALVGGVSYLFSHTYFVAFSQAGMLSPAGACKTFDASADGYVRGEGAGLILIKPLEQALADNDRIYGIVDSVAINHGGKVATVTSPSAYAQANLIKLALSKASLSAADISYVEVHGTGTPKGDPIEINGLKRAFRSETSTRLTEDDCCFISCVKPNIGHLESAAGIAGLIKGLLSLQHQKILPIRGLKNLNPKITLDGTRFKMVTEEVEWQPRRLRRFGLSSFGFGGVNAHAIVSEFQDARVPEQRPSDGVSLFCFSAISERQLRTYAMVLAAYISRQPAVPTHHIAYSLARRTAHQCRFSLIYTSRQGLLEKLTAVANGLPILPVSATGQTITDAGAAWMQGENIDIASVFQLASHHIVYVPPYPFEQKQYFPDILFARDAVTASQPEAESQLCQIEIQYQSGGAAGNSSLQAKGPVIALSLLNAENQRHFSRIQPEIAVISIPAPDAVFFDEPGKWVQWYQQYVELLREAISDRKPDHCLLLSDQHADLIEPLFLTGLSLEKEFGLSCAWYQLPEQGCQIAEQALERFFRVDAHVSGHYRLENGAKGLQVCQRGVQVKPFSPDYGSFAFSSPPVVFMTGGAGGIGQILSKYLAEQFAATVWIAGRRPAEQISADVLDSSRGKILYIQADCSSRGSLTTAIQHITLASGSVDLIVHAAGQIKDKSLFFKTASDIQDVVESKVVGCQLLDELTRQMDIKQFIVFSSITGLFGNPGQTDYAAANSFLTAFVRQRNQKVAKGQRCGKTTAIHWPYWINGGMQIPQSAIAMLQTTTGTEPLSSAEGERIFLHVLQKQPAEICVARGKLNDIQQALGSVSVETMPKPAASVDVLSVVLDVVSDILGCTIEKSRFEVRFSELGIDSIALQAVARDVSEATGTKVSSLTFVKYPTIASVVSHIRSLQEDPTALVQAQALPVQVAMSGQATEVVAIGMSLRMAGCDRWRAAWPLLSQKVVFPGAFPKERWQLLPESLTATRQRENYVGYFLDNGLAFDHKFFGISRREAMQMDPQQRLLLEQVWHAIADAGYAPEQFRQLKTAVFVCIDANDYATIARTDSHIDEFSVEATTPYLSANRISHIYDLEGPSETLNVACASVYSAIEKAHGLIASGVVSQAIIAATQLNLLPERFDMLSSRELLSRSGIVSPFDINADGFVRSEGVGCLILKSLQLAERDKDQVLVKVRSAAAWHSGKGSSLTSPNPLGHISVIQAALAKAQARAGDIKYIEAHGTASKVGDLAEAQAISAVLAQDPQAKSCVVSSLKSNLGHLEVCSGIAAFVRVLLSIQHKTVPGLPELKHIQPDIDVDKIKMSCEEQPLECDKALIGLLAYGLGGVSSFTLLEPYHSQGPELAAHVEQSTFWICLSANNFVALKRYASSVLDEIHLFSAQTPLSVLETTLRDHRVHQAARVLIAVSCYAVLSEKLTAFVLGEQVDQLYTSEDPEELSAQLPELWKNWLRGLPVQQPSTPQSRRSFWPCYAFEREENLFVMKNRL